MTTRANDFNLDVLRAFGLDPADGYTSLTLELRAFEPPRLTVTKLVKEDGRLTGALARHTYRLEAEAGERPAASPEPDTPTTVGG
jgi:hypothetical protein